MTLSGRATPEATSAYAARFDGRLSNHHFRASVDGLWLSSLGLGTYLGENDDATDARYQGVVERMVTLGCNHIDTAVSYRNQRSERTIGRALSALVARGEIQRDMVVVATKGGFVPFDGEPPADPRRWVYQQFIESGLAHANDFVASYQHCIAPDFLDAMIARSRQNLGVDTIDIYYLHNPETQQISNTHATFRHRMLDAFETLEDAVLRGDIASYGLATWTAFRTPPNAPDYLSLTELVGLAFEVAGEANHFRYVQMPYNLVMTEAFALENQQLGEQFTSAIETANALGLTVTVSATLKQGTLASPFMADLRDFFPGMDTDAQRAIQFARSTPGVTSALVGMSHENHLVENMVVAARDPITPEVIRRMFGQG